MAGSLFLIPCCNTASSKLDKFFTPRQVLKSKLSPTVYNGLILSRSRCLDFIKSNLEGDENRAINEKICAGYELNGNQSAFYSPLLSSFSEGIFESEELKREIKKSLSVSEERHFLIISSFYGVLHPLDDIQSHHLDMSDVLDKWSRNIAPIISDYIKRHWITEIHLFFPPDTSHHDFILKELSEVFTTHRLKRVISYEHTQKKNNKNAKEQLAKDFSNLLLLKISSSDRSVPENIEEVNLLK